MSTTPDFDQLARTWMQDGPSEMPDRALTAALDEVHVTSQQRFGAARRTFHMNTNAWRLAAAAVIAILLVGAGVYLFGRAPGGIGVPAPTPSPSPSPTPVPPLPSSGAINPGTYVLAFPGAPSLTMTIPAGWRNGGAGGPAKNDGTPSTLGLSPWIVRNIYADPCLWADGLVQPPVGPSVDDLATALAKQPRRNGTTPTTVTLGGYQGKFMELSVPADLDTATCSQVPGTTGTAPHFFVTWVGPGIDEYNGLAAPGSHDRVWILDVDGVRFVLDATDFPGAGAQDGAELQSIIDSIQIGPATPLPSPSTSP